jgi:hypothetical protein
MIPSATESSILRVSHLYGFSARKLTDSRFALQDRRWNFQIKGNPFDKMVGNVTNNGPQLNLPVLSNEVPA